jgi:O-antigen ligase
MSKRSRKAKPSKSLPRADRPPWAAIGVCLFLVGFAAPIPIQWPLVALVLFASVAAFSEGAAPEWQVPLPFTLAVIAFLLLTGLSIFLSVDRSRSLELSASWIPGLLLFVVIAERLRSADDLRAVYACFALVGLGLAVALLVGRWSYGADSHAWLQGLGLPVLVVPNDCHFLALLTPFSLVLADRNPRSGLGVLALVSILMTGGAILALGSRGGALTLIAGLVVTGTLLRPRLGIGLGVAVLLGVGLGDALLGFPLASKFTHVVDTRVSLWMIAWEMFLDAPWVGQGPHSYRSLYTIYMEAITFPEWVRMDPWGTEVPWAHNLYLELLAERGILGFASFAALVGTAFFLGIKARAQGSPEEFRLACGAVGALLGLLVSGLFEASLLRIWVVVLLFVLAGVIGRLAALTGDSPGGDNSLGTASTGHRGKPSQPTS